MQFALPAVLACSLVARPAPAGDEEWLSMDSELESMRSFAAQTNGVELSGWILASLRHADDVIGGLAADNTTTNDVGGFNLDSVRLNLAGDVGEQGYFVSFELGDADGARKPFAGQPNRTGQLLDAYIDWRVAESISLRVGNFRMPFVQSALVQRNQTLFVDRSAIGAIHSSRQAGVQLTGDFGTLRWYIAAQNGLDSVGDEMLYSGRVEIDVMGDSNAAESARGSDDPSVTIGFAASDDGGHVDGVALAADAEVRIGALYFAGEIVDYDDGTSPGGGAPTDFGLDWLGVAGVPIFANANNPVTDVSDTTPWAVTAAAVVSEDQVEIGVRYEDNDHTNGDTIDQEAITFGVNRYVGKVKWQLTYTLFRTDAPAPAADTDILALALSLGF